MSLNLQKTALIHTLECDGKTSQYHVALVACMVQVALWSTEAVWDEGGGFGT